VIRAGVVHERVPVHLSASYSGLLSRFEDLIVQFGDRAIAGLSLCEDLNFARRSLRRNNSATQMKSFLQWTQNSGNTVWLTVRTRHGRGGRIPEAVNMRSLSFILALAFLCAGATLADPADNGLPGIGTFVYGGSQVPASKPVVMFAER